MSAGNLAKPQLRGLLSSQLKRHLATAAVLSVVGAVAWKVGVMDPRKKAYADFYKTYDGEKDYIRMKKAGVFPPHNELNYPPKNSIY